jgi:hypothetical protein
MKKFGMKSHFVMSFEDASILRKFSILFWVASIIPLLILLYTYSQSSANGYSSISTEVLSNAMLIMLIGVFATYITMRAMLTKVLEISTENRRKLEILLGNKTIEEFVQEQNEIVKLRQSFAVVTQQLEQILHNFESGKK